ncbi:sirohydrochlorin chelatase [Sphaerisporangium sp. TRM90804]|uniref:sirohydrochlorin chelatase n=1 Tax=Sphaerisporangium sp. TRM90804 TaxID=3031113 RepID=UPI00244CF951|nr:sirohydrochlorin chelatase [Sphaerisporangium sp. TRM90804]MDH2429725.1 sirohydrochlorin chelatase [Sphaerisporangium sp. TRM90804]
MKPPLVLIGHGAHDDTGAAEFGRFVHRLRCRLDQVVADVSGGFVARGRPSLSDSVASLVTRGHHRLVTIPLTLFESDEVPAAVMSARATHPSLTCDSGPCLGAAPRVLALMAERLADALAEMPRLAAVTHADESGEAPWEPVTPAETAVVLVGHGSADAAANAEVHRVSRLFWERHAPELLTVETAYVADAPPSVAQGIERCRRLGARRVVVLPYLLFAGGVLERIWAEALAYAAGHTTLDVRCAEVIGDCEGLADLIIERYEEILAAAEPPMPDHVPDDPRLLPDDDEPRLPSDPEEELLAPSTPWAALKAPPRQGTPHRDRRLPAERQTPRPAASWDTAEATQEGTPDDDPLPLDESVLLRAAGPRGVADVSAREGVPDGDALPLEESVLLRAAGPRGVADVSAREGVPDGDALPLEESVLLRVAAPWDAAEAAAGEGVPDGGALPQAGKEPLRAVDAWDAAEAPVLTLPGGQALDPPVRDGAASGKGRRPGEPAVRRLSREEAAMAEGLV